MRTRWKSTPYNTFLWRMQPRRLDTTSLRDAMLAVSGQFNLTLPVGSAVARTGEGRVPMQDWHATILHLLGLDGDQLTYRYAGRDICLTDVNVPHFIRWAQLRFDSKSGAP